MYETLPIKRVPGKAARLVGRFPSLEPFKVSDDPLGRYYVWSGPMSRTDVYSESGRVLLYFTCAKTNPFEDKELARVWATPLSLEDEHRLCGLLAKPVYVKGAVGHARIIWILVLPDAAL